MNDGPLTDSCMANIALVETWYQISTPGSLSSTRVALLAYVAHIAVLSADLIATQCAADGRDESRSDPDLAKTNVEHQKIDMQAIMASGARNTC